MSSKHNSILFTVVIPVYKRKKFVVEALHSVLFQRNVDMTSIEIVVSDDDKANKNNKKYYEGISDRVVYTKNKNEKGPGGNRQTGLEIARGKYVVFLDSDDRLKPDFLHKMNKVLTKKDVAALCLSKAAFEPNFDVMEKIKIYLLMFIRDFSLSISYLLNRKTLYPPSYYLCQLSHMMFVREKIDKLRFNYDYKYGGEDWDFIARAQDRGGVKIFPQRLIVFRYSPSSTTIQNKKRKWNSYKLMIRKLPRRYKKTIFHNLFLRYIRLFGGKYTTKNWTDDMTDTITFTKHLLSNLSMKVRKDQFKIFEGIIRPTKKTKILDVGATSDETLKDSNMFEKVYKWPSKITAATIENPKKLKVLYPKIKTRKIFPRKPLPFKRNEFGVAVSWATLEHVGGYKDQERFINELLRVSKSVFITTPYRAAPYEPHTGFWFLHWLPLGWFRKICNLMGKDFWASEDNLNPLYIQDIEKMNLEEKVNIQAYKTFNLLPTHIIITSND